MKNFFIIKGAVLFLGSCVSTIAAEPEIFSKDQALSRSLTAEKAKYHLFRPTPIHLMREMSTDRPDKTESPYTVDAGHYQVETSVVDYMYDHHNPDEMDTKIEAFQILSTNLKAGLSRTIDFQLVFDSYIHEYTRTDGVLESNQGFGDIQTRLKVNLWGNDGGQTALAVMPFLKFPTNENNLANDALEGGVIWPLAVGLPGGWGMGLMAEFDMIEDADGDDYHAEFIHTVTFGHNIVGHLDGYVEFFSHLSNETAAPWIATVDAGLTYGMSPDIQFDVGLNVGVVEAADDLNPFCGISWRYY